MRKCAQCKRVYADDVEVCPDDGTALASVKALRQVKTIGDYQVLSEIGHGGMATVYRAIHKGFNEERALKVINEEFAREPEFKERFEREVTITRHLAHPNIVSVKEAGWAQGGLPFLAMEYAGPSLASLIKMGPLTQTRALHIAGQICNALAAAHQKNIIHRDIKPENILVSGTQDRETAKVADFGIAKVRKGAALSKSTNRTQIGVIMGTPEYLSPEQASGKSDIDGRSDIYSVGVVLYEMLTGKPPFSEEVPMATIVHHIQTQPMPLSQNRPDLHISRTAEEITLKALQKDPAHRFQSAEEMLLAIQDAIREPESPYVGPQVNRGPQANPRPTPFRRLNPNTPSPIPHGKQSVRERQPSIKDQEIEKEEKVEVVLVGKTRKTGFLSRILARFR